MTQQEVFPDSVSFVNPLTRQEMQVGDTCTCFGFSSSAEAMAQRAGIQIGSASQISPYFNWYFMDKARVSVEEALRTANRVGYVPDELYPFKGFPLSPPDSAAFQCASEHRGEFAVARVNGVKQLMRAICKGSPLITERIGVTMPHIEACVGYDKISGFQIQGSGMVTDHWPWGELPIFTQLLRYTRSPFPFIPFPGYIPADDPVFDNWNIRMPMMLEYDASTITMKEVFNVEGHITGISHVTWNNDLSTEEPMWKKVTNELHLPTLKLGEEIYYGVIAYGVTWAYDSQQ